MEPVVSRRVGDRPGDDAAKDKEVERQFSILHCRITTRVYFKLFYDAGYYESYKELLRSHTSRGDGIKFSPLFPFVHYSCARGGG